MGLQSLASGCSAKPGDQIMCHDQTRAQQASKSMNLLAMLVQMRHSRLAPAGCGQCLCHRSKLCPRQGDRMFVQWRPQLVQTPLMPCGRCSGRLPSGCQAAAVTVDRASGQDPRTKLQKVVVLGGTGRVGGSTAEALLDRQALVPSAASQYFILSLLCLAWLI